MHLYQSSFCGNFQTLVDDHIPLQTLKGLMLFNSGLINKLNTFLPRYNTIYVSLWHVLALCDILETINNSFR